MVRQELRDVVIVLPGIMGSVLEKDGVDLWEASFGAAWRGLRLGAMAEHLPIQEPGLMDEELGDGIRATRLVALPSIVSRFVKMDGYTALRDMIAAAFRVDPGVGSSPGNYHEFPYDWRRDNRVAARALASLVERILPDWRAFTGDRGAKAILIGHSMGGLVARYYAEVLGGWRDCRALITLGTPHRGSLNALDVLANGPGWPFGSFGPIARTFPSIHQLLPIYQVLEHDGTLRRVAEAASVPGVDAAMAASALRFHREIEEAVQQNHAEAAYHEGFRTIPIVGTDQPTNQGSALEAGRVVVRRDCPGWLDPLLGGGDGTVPRISATPIELSGEAREYFLPEHHGMLQSNPHLLDALRNLLAQLLSRGLGAIRGPVPISGAPGTAAISLDVDDAQPAGHPVEVRAWLREDGGNGRDLEGVVTPVDHPGAPIRGRLAEAGEGRSWRVEDLPPGRYRVEVRASRGGQGAPTPVQDVFAVVAGEVPEA